MSELSNKYGLSIRFSSDGFSLSVSDEFGILLSSRKISANVFSLTKDNIIDILSDIAELNTVYNTTRLICETDTYVIVPDKLFDKDIAEEFVRTQHPYCKLEGRIVWNNLLAWNAVVAFAVPEGLFAVLNGTFPEIEIEHHLFAFINDFVALQNSTSVFVVDRNNKLDVIVIKQGILQLVNTFAYSTKEDFLYHILNIYTILALDTENCPLKIYFEKQKPEIKELVKKYIGFVKL